MKRHLGIQIQDDFHGPTLTELGDFIDPNTPTEVRWEGSREDFIALKKHSTAQLVLMVKDMNALERATSALGVSYGFPPKLLEEAKKLLLSRSAGLEWRRFVGIHGTGVSRGILTKIINDGVQQGRKPKIASLLASCWTEGLNPSDIEILMDLV